MAKKVFQVIDHCTIYFLIAGTYTPMVLCGLMKTSPVWAWIIFSIVWGCAALAVTLTAIDLEKFKVFSMISYIAMGWAILLSIKNMYYALGHAGFALLLMGGVLYTGGGSVALSNYLSMPHNARVNPRAQLGNAEGYVKYLSLKGV